MKTAKVSLGTPYPNFDPQLFTDRVAPGLTPSMSQESLLFRMRLMVSACSLVKPTLTSDTGRFPPFSHMSVMDEKNACDTNAEFRTTS